MAEAVGERRRLWWGWRLLWALLLALLVGLTLVSLFGQPRMSVDQTVRFPATSQAAARAAVEQASAPGGMPDLVANQPNVAADAPDLASRAQLSVTDGQVGIVVQDPDAQRALRDTDAITDGLMSRIPQSDKVKLDTIGLGVVDRNVGQGLGLVTLIVLAVTALGSRHPRRLLAMGGIWGSALLLSVLALQSSIHSPLLEVSLGVLAALLAVAIAVVQLGWWRASVLLTLALTVFRSGTFSGLLPNAVWLAGQFLGIAVATLATLVPWLVRRYPALGRSSLATRAACWSRLPAEQAPERPRTSRAPLVGAVALGCLCLWAVASTLWSPFRGATLSQAALFAVVVAFLASTALLRWRDAGTALRDLEMVFWIGAIGLLLSWLPFLPHAAHWQVEPRTGRFVGFTSNSNFAGSLTAVTIALGLAAAWHHRRTLAWWPVAIASALLVIPLYLSGSRGALLGCGLATVVFLVARRLWRWLGGLAAVGVLGFALLALTHHLPSIFVRQEGGHDAGVDSGREVIYVRALKLWEHDWLHGYGYRTTERIVATGQTAHNIELSTLVELGIVGAILFALVVLAALWSALRRHPSPWLPALLAVLVVEQFNSTLYGFSGPASLTMWLAIAAAAATAWSHRRPRVMPTLTASPDVALPGATTSPEPVSAHVEDVPRG